MAEDASRRSLAFSTSEILFGKSRSGIAILLGLTLAVVPSRSAFGQISQQQQREQQQREQQAREQKQQDERQREEQERQRQTPVNPANSSTAASPSLDSSVSRKPNAATESHVPSQAEPGDKPVAPRAQTPEPDVRSNAAASNGKNTTSKDQNLRVPAPDLRHKACDKEPCAEPGPKPVPPDLHAKVCKDGPCPICAPGQ